MTGLDLESFLLLLRADLAIWAILVLAGVGVAFLVWSCWRSRRLLRNCLVASLAVHLGLVLYGSTFPTVMWSLGVDRRDPARSAHIRRIRVAPLPEAARLPGRDQLPAIAPPELSNGARRAPRSLRWDMVDAPLALADAPVRAPRPKVENGVSTTKSVQALAAPAAVETATPQGAAQSRETPPLEPRAVPASNGGTNPPIPAQPLPPSMAEVEGATGSSAPAQGGERNGSTREPASPSTLLALASDRRLRPERPELVDQSRARAGSAITFERGTRERPAGEARRRGSIGRATTETGQGVRVPAPLLGRGSGAPGGPIPSVRATPKAPISPVGGAGLAALGDRIGSHNLADIPRIYQPRLDPNRSTRAQRTGASAASELAVERAIDWLTRHQDDDGRWNAGIAHYQDGTAVTGDDDFTSHCPAGEKCVGACAYWEADTALSGLALLTYLGAGYTHTEGRYVEAVGKGLDYLIAEQKPDGDLRGRSRVVGMYCHAMATLALCEAFALSGDDRLRDPAERAVAFLVRARAKDQMAWRYAPGAVVGDTSILGWVVMGLKSAKEVGIPIPEEPAVRRGILLWLDKVAAGEAKGLARYQPSEPVTPTMTAEAWVCRQFLGQGAPGPASDEAAALLLRTDSDKGPTNVYYWYYATLAFYQHGGEPWSRWNAKIRDRIVGLQCTSGHQSGSWEPDGSLYGKKGGRIYCTALAALSLEVYYRYLRLYDEPKIRLEAGATPPAGARSGARSVPSTATSNPQDR
jgi:hypothetical protein